MTPRLSVVIRSFNRVPMLCDLVEVVLGQDHDGFEVVVVEQSTAVDDAAAARLAGLEADPRLRVLRHPPLGGARARNVGVAAARGALVVFLDDDDQPVGKGFLAAMERAMADPRCLGLTCRHEWSGRRPSWWYRLQAPYRCLRWSLVLGLPVAYARCEVAVKPVDYVHGTGGVIRRAAFERFGGWDEDTPIEDEASFGLRAGQQKGADEYFAFEPSILLRRDLDAGGGLGKRSLTAGRFYEKLMTFVHNVLGRYRPVRVRLLYPLYVLGVAGWTLDWIWGDSLGHDRLGKKLAGIAGFLVALPYHAARMALRPIGPPQASPPGGDAAARATPTG